MTKKARLLLIEEEGYVIDRVGEILKSFPHFEHSVCSDAKEARERLEKEDFDLVLADIYLAGVSGLELSFRARKRNPQTAVVLITSLDNVELASKGLKEGALDFVMKPPGLDRLANILKLFSLVRGFAPGQV